MHLRKLICRSVFVIPLALCTHAFAADVPAAEGAMAKNLAAQKLGPLKGMPTCATGAVLNGDPGKEGSLLLVKMAAGCKVPWHWHTPVEHVMIASGMATVEVKDAAPVILRSGGYASMPSQHVHQFTCTTACVIFVHADGPLDIHYVDESGKEMTPDEALAKKKM